MRSIVLHLDHLNLTFHTHYATIRFHLSGRVTEEIEKQNGHMGGLLGPQHFQKIVKKKFEEIEKNCWHTPERS